MAIARVSDAQRYDLIAERAGRLEVALERLQEQIASGRRLLSPEQDPLGAWHLLAVKTRDEALLERAIRVVDLRFLPERIRLRLDPSVLVDQGA